MCSVSGTHSLTSTGRHADTDLDYFFAGSNDIEWEYESICGPHRHEIWPDEFIGGVPGLAAELSALQEQAQLLIAAGPLDGHRNSPPPLPQDG